MSGRKKIGSTLSLTRRFLFREGAVVVEGGDALRGRHEIQATFFCDLCNEIDNSLLIRPVVPRWKRVGSGGNFLNQGGA
jgi:hypothetical protein